MIQAAFYLFWVGSTIILYTYVGYGAVIYFLAKLKGRLETPKFPLEIPEVTLIIAAYNEAGFIEKKILDTLSLDYPKEKISIFIVTDGSTDQTPEIARQFSAIQLFHEPQRKGKIHAVNRIMKFVKTPIVIYCDANTFLNPKAIKNIVRHYTDKKVGGVAGEKRILKKSEDNASGAGEGLYWKYESFLKRKDSEVYSVVGAAGELFSIRTALFEEPPGDSIIEDFYMSMRIVSKGYRFIYEPEAYAIETASASVEEEWKRKVRICAGGFQSMLRLKELLNPIRYGVLSFQYISHRVLRWTLAPLSLPIVLGSNIILITTGHWFYFMTLCFQLIFYAFAGFGYLLRDKNISIKGFFVPYYFLVMNISVYAGFIRFIRGNQSVVWEKSKRAEA
ncbi:MAG: glycosyltransferase family 2 protein [Cyclobacteriaceae bacterium]|nr:glycosyltransferase family 2 protein [Cyclobacteriaceae bacterium]